MSREKFGLSLSLECSGEISRQSVKSTYPIISLKVGVFLQNANARFWLVKFSQQLVPCSEIITPNKTPNQWEKKPGLPSVYYNRSRFSGKSTALQQFFLYIAQCSSIQDDHVIMGKDAKGKGKGKTRAKRVFERSGSSAAAELVVGVWPNQEPLSPSARLVFFGWQNGAFSFFFGPVSFVFFTQGLFLLLIFP